MTSTSSGSPARAPEAAEYFIVALARAFGGALFFSLPVLMTMEAWWLGFTMDRFRLGVLVLAFAPLLVALDRYSGFEDTSRWTDDVIDAAVAIAVGYVTSALVLTTLGIIDLRGGQALDEVLGMIALQAVPASFGAVLARSQFGEGSRTQDQDVGYAGELLFMLAGGIFLSFNIAPTGEIPAIACKMGPGHGLVLLAGSLACMHAFVYAVDFRGGVVRHPATSQVGIFIRYTVVGYAISLFASAAMLWAFGRFDGSGLSWAVLQTVVLAFPASLGAAGARLIL